MWNALKDVLGSTKAFPPIQHRYPISRIETIIQDIPVPSLRDSVLGLVNKLVLLSEYVDRFSLERNIEIPLKYFQST